MAKEGIFVSFQGPEQNGSDQFFLKSFGRSRKLGRDWSLLKWVCSVSASAVL